MRILTWNLEWAQPGTRHEQVIRARLNEFDADIMCLTEAFAASLPSGGHVIEAAAGNDVADRKGAKKVILWSRTPWADAANYPHFHPPGRLVSGTTLTDCGPIRLFGVCIPWAGSGTRRVGGDRRPWGDHLDFLEESRGLWGNDSRRTIVIGDFNQRMPRSRQPRNVADALQSALSNLVVATYGFVDGSGSLTIDHIAHSRDLAATEVSEIAKAENELRLSDHFGVAAVLQPA